LLLIGCADGGQADTEFIFSRWYCLDMGYVPCLGDMSRVSTEISDSLSARLSVPTSVFVISTPVLTSSGLSINLSLAQHNIPGLHNSLCHLQLEFPAFRICEEDVELLRISHGRNQHLYIRNQEVFSKKNQPSISEFRRDKRYATYEPTLRTFFTRDVKILDHKNCKNKCINISFRSLYCEPYAQIMLLSVF
jgi:hypothetical protein